MKKKHSFINIGFSSILMVFIMICIATFASLSVATANSDYNLSKKVESKTTSYYKADTTAKEVLAAIDSQLGDYYQNGSASGYYSAVATDLQSKIESVSEDVKNLTISDDGKTIEYDVTISDTQTLHIKLEVASPSSQDDTFVRIVNWSTVTTNEPSEGDGKLKVYN